MESARIIIEVTAGLIPTKPELEFTKRWVITSTEWNARGDDVGILLADYNGRALGYASYLMLQPNRVNWVRTEWIYL